MKLMPVLYRHGVERFRDPEDRIRYLQRVREEIEGGRLSGVRSAPGIFIDGRRHDVSFELGSLADAVSAVLPGLSVEGVHMCGDGAHPGRPRQRAGLH